MGDYMNFHYTLKEVYKPSEQDCRLVYSPFHKFEYPNCHRVQGGLRVENGHITAALILYPDYEDEHLVWPAQLQFKLLARKKGKTELLGAQEMVWNFKEIEEFSEKIQWEHSINCSLEQLKEKNMIDQEDSVTFVWAVKLYFPQSEGFNTVTSSSSTTSQKSEEGKTTLQAFKSLDAYRGQEFEITSSKDTSLMRMKADNKNKAMDEEVLTITDDLEKEMTELYNLDFEPVVLELLDIKMDTKQSPKLYEKNKYEDDVSEDTKGHRYRSIFRSKSSKIASSDSQIDLEEISTSQSKVHEFIQSSAHSDMIMSENVDSCSSAKSSAEADLVALSKPTPLMLHCLRGDTLRELMMEDQSDIDAQGPLGMTALMFASLKGHKDAVEFLIKKKADIHVLNDFGMNAMMIATMKCHIEIIEMLIANGSPPDTFSKWKNIATGKVFRSSPMLHGNVMSCKLTCLIIAAASNQLKIVGLLLDHGADINAKTDNGMTALKAACCKGHQEMVRLLLEHGADVNSSEKRSSTPLMFACKENKMDIISILLENDAQVNTQTTQGTTALMLASATGSANIVTELLKKGAGVNVQTEKGLTALMLAAHSGSEIVVQLLVKYNSNVDEQDKRGFTSLMFASSRGHTEVVKALLESDAVLSYNLHSRGVRATVSLLFTRTLHFNSMIRRCDNDGKTALTYASINGHSEIVRLLLTAGADANSADKDKKTALMYVSKNGDMESFEELIYYGADVHRADKDGRTPLMYASINGRPDIMHSLIKANAGKEARDNTGMTSLTLACKNGHHNAVECLIQNGASVRGGRYTVPKGCLTPLTAACRYGHLKVVRLLLKEKDKMTTDDKFRAILISHEYEHSTVCQTLLDALSKKM